MYPWLERFVETTLMQSSEKEVVTLLSTSKEKRLHEEIVLKRGDCSKTRHRGAPAIGRDGPCSPRCYFIMVLLYSVCFCTWGMFYSVWNRHKGSGTERCPSSRGFLKRYAHSSECHDQLIESGHVLETTEEPCSVWPLCHTTGQRKQSSDSSEIYERRENSEIAVFWTDIFWSLCAPSERKYERAVKIIPYFRFKFLQKENQPSTKSSRVDLSKKDLGHYLSICLVCEQDMYFFSTFSDMSQTEWMNEWMIQAAVGCSSAVGLPDTFEQKHN